MILSSTPVLHYSPVIPKIWINREMDEDTKDRKGGYSNINRAHKVTSINWRTRIIKRSAGFSFIRLLAEITAVAGTMGKRYRF